MTGAGAHGRAAGLGLAVVVLTTALVWALAGSSAATTAVRAVADLAAAVTLGLSVVARLDAPRYRTELTQRAARPLAVAAGVWLLSEVVRLLVSAAQAAATPIGNVSVRTLVEFTWNTAPGRTGLFSLLAAGLVAALVLVSPRAPAMVAVTGVAAAGIAARSVTGHISESLLGSAGVVLHALAATLWFGTLAAMALTVSTRGQWARVLPVYSQLALACVVVLLAGGTVAALTALATPADLIATGYGRILLAKVALTLAVLVLAGINRAGWLRAARAHRVTAQHSLRRSVIELVLLTAALTLAAALTVTG